TYSNKSKVDGIPKSQMSITNIPYDAATNACLVSVKAPSPLMYLTDLMMWETTDKPAATFSMTVSKKTVNMVTSNVHSGRRRQRLAVQVLG
ncbi:hypothetical protein H0H81_007741, partial [Sphagnurus paluster]